ncbi:MAG: DoxX family protein [Gordonia sp. (in: high G+C Gram-positive bacteria)]
MNLIAALGRAMTGVPYIKLGYDAATAPGQRVDTAAPLLDKVRQVVPIPVDNETVVRANGAAMAVGGALVASSLAPRAGAALLVGALVPTTVAGHPFWKSTDPAQRAMNQTQFLKNMAMCGGLVVIAASRKR